MRVRPDLRRAIIAASSRAKARTHLRDEWSKAMQRHVTINPFNGTGFVLGQVNDIFVVNKMEISKLRFLDVEEETER